MKKLAPLTGVLGVAFVIAAFAVGGETPDANDNVDKVVNFYSDKDTKTLVAGILLAYAAIVLLAFFTVFRNRLRKAEGGEAGASTFAFAGGIFFSMGLAIFGGINFALGDIGSDAPAKVDGSAIQALNILNSDFFIPLAVGVGAFLIGAAIGIFKTGFLPKWLGWAALVAGIVAVTPLGFFALLFSGLWIIAASILIYTRGDSAAAGPAV